MWSLWIIIVKIKARKMKSRNSLAAGTVPLFSMKMLLLITCLTSFILSSWGQTESSKIDKKDLKTFVQILTSDSLEGRGTGTEGQRKAGRFISKRFKELGLNAYSQNGYLQTFKLKQTYWGHVYLKTQSKTLENFENMIFQGSNVQNDEAEKEVVFGGRGTEEELNQIEVKDRLVLVFVKNLRGYWDINKRLGQRQASGIILANPDDEKQFESIKKTFKDYSLQKRLSLPGSDTMQNTFTKWDTIRFINTITIPNSEIRSISGYLLRDLAKMEEENRIKDVPTTNMKVKFERIQNEVETANVVGIIKGTSNKSIVVSAHYDHLGKSGKEYFPGADDNASGTAALLELAEEYSKSTDLKYNIVFLATSGEEAGLLGSTYYVNHPDFQPENILCDLNLDMISRSDDKHSNKKYLYCIGTDQSAEIDLVIKKADRLFDNCSFDYALNDSKSPAGLFTRSDNYSFYKKGIPAIQFFSGLHSDYHKPTDTADKIDYENLEDRVRQISLVIDLLQREGLKN